MQIQNKPDALAGFAFIAIGVVFTIVASGYQLGTASDMGPGFLPVMLGVLLMGLGALTLLSAIRPSADNIEKLPKIKLRPILCILGAALLFGISLKGVRAIGLPSLGFMPSVFMSAFLATFSDPETKIKQAIPIAAILTVLTSVLFITLLGLPLQYFAIKF